MNKKPTIQFAFLVLAFIVIISGCAPKVTPTPIGVYIETSVAATMQSQATLDSLYALEQRMTQQALPTSTPAPTLTPFATPTLSMAVNTPIPTTGAIETQPPVSTQPIYPTATATPKDICLRATLVNETIHDGSVKMAGEKFTKTWTFTNTGTCTWNTEFDFSFRSGERMIGNDMDLNEVVEPGGQIVISMPMKAPVGVGEHIGFWSFRSNKGEYFGVGDVGAENVYVSIVVK